MWNSLRFTVKKKKSRNLERYFMKLRVTQQTTMSFGLKQMYVNSDSPFMKTNATRPQSQQMCMMTMMMYDYVFSPPTMPSSHRGQLLATLCNLASSQWITDSFLGPLSAPPTPTGLSKKTQGLLKGIFVVPCVCVCMCVCLCVYEILNTR